MGNKEKNKEPEVECPLCGGKGSVETVDEEGTPKEAECPVCEGRGKVSLRRVRYLYRYMQERIRTSRLSPFGSKYGSRHSPHGGGRFRRPFSMLLPLTMDPRAGAENTVYPENVSSVPRAAPVFEKRKPQDEVRVEETIVPPAKEDSEVPEKCDEELEPGSGQGILEERVVREFSVPDSQLEVNGPVEQELVLGESQEMGLEVTHEGLSGDSRRRRKNSGKKRTGSENSEGRTSAFKKNATTWSSSGDS